MRFFSTLGTIDIALCLVYSIFFICSEIWIKIALNINLGTQNQEKATQSKKNIHLPQLCFFART